MIGKPRQSFNKWRWNFAASPNSFTPSLSTSSASKHLPTQISKRQNFISSAMHRRRILPSQGASMTRILIALFLLSLTQIQAHAQSPGGSDIQAGQEIWQGYFNLENDCKLCHGAKGEGGFAKPLAGHQLTTAQFLRVVRQGAGKTMPAFVPDKNLNDQQIAQVAAYLASLPKSAEPGSMWRTPVPPLATPRQKLYIESGCGQCHAAIFANPRRTAGGLGGDYEWFKTEVYQHTSAPDHANSRHLRMGNFSREQ